MIPEVKAVHDSAIANNHNGEKHIVLLMCNNILFLDPILNCHSIYRRYSLMFYKNLDYTEVEKVAEVEEVKVVDVVKVMVVGEEMVLCKFSDHIRLY